MSRKCLVCSHKFANKIDESLLNKTPYLAISRKFNLSKDSVRSHAKNHLQPILNEANEQAKEKMVDKFLQMREEVNYPTLDKVKVLQQRILNDLDKITDVSQKVLLYKEFRGAIQEEAKLCGAYQKEQENKEVLDVTARNVVRTIRAYPTANLSILIETGAEEAGLNKELLTSKVNAILTTDNPSEVLN